MNLSGIITSVWVPGHPKTKGSLTFFGSQQVEENVKGSPEWRALVAGAVRRDLTERRQLGIGSPEPHDGPVEVITAFWLERPLGVPFSRGGIVPAIWPRAGDVDKLARNVLDACAADARDAAMNGGAFVNDNQVVNLMATKMTAREGPMSSGALVMVRVIHDDELIKLERELRTMRGLVLQGSTSTRDAQRWTR